MTPLRTEYFLQQVFIQAVMGRQQTEEYTTLKASKLVKFYCFGSGLLYNIDSYSSDLLKVQYTLSLQQTRSFLCFT